MTTTTITVPDDTAGKVKRNAEIAWQSLSIRTSWLLSIATAVFLGLNPSGVIAFLSDHLPVAIGGSIVYGALVHLARLVPQDIQTKSDKQAATVAWLVDLIGRALPGQPVTVPASVVASLGLPSPVVVTPPNKDAASAPVEIPLTPPAPAVTPLVDKMAAVRPMFPGLTDDQIRAELASPKPQPAIVVPPFLQPQPAPGT